MKITVLDGYTENPGDLSWDWLEALGETSIYDCTPDGLIAVAILPIDHVVARAKQADVAQLGQLFERFAAQRSFVCYDYLAARRPLR